MVEAPKVWTVYTAHQANPYSSISWGSARKWKTFEINKKVRMDSPSEFTAQIEYDSSIIFNDLIRFERDNVVQGIYFIEDIEIAWDENGRYLNIGGRDLTLLLWRKYVENFNNAISDTLGFFGNVDAVELIKFLLRTPRSDLPMVPDDNLPANQLNSVYAYNKEGWGIDITNFTGLETSCHTDGYGDINTTILRKREMLWANSGSPFEVSASSEGCINGVSSCSWEEHGLSPYINDSTGGIIPTNYIKSHINVNDTAEFTFDGLNPSNNASGINNCYLSIKQAPDGSWDWWDGSNCFVYVWVESWNMWCAVGSFGGRSSANGIYDISKLSWQTYIYDLSSILMTVNDVNNTKIRFVEQGSLSTYIQYVYISVGYKSNGNIQANEWVNIMFKPMECMGVYIESRESTDQFPHKYHITTNGGAELFEGYTEHDGDSYITLDAAKDQLTFDSYQTNDPSKIAYFYRQGIREGDTGPIGDFNEYISFSISSSQPCSVPPDYFPAFIPWCLANEVNDFYTIWNGSGNATCFDVTNQGGVLYPEFRLKSGGSTSNNVVGTVLTIGSTYWLRVTRTGSTLTYNLYKAETMRVSELIASWTFSCNDTYIYRYQAITFNNEEWAELFNNPMDASNGGEQINNGGFETGDTTGWNGTSGYAVTTTTEHQNGGSWSLLVYYSNSTIIYTDPYDILRADVTSASIWIKQATSKVLIQLLWTDATEEDWYVDATGDWFQVDLLSHWTDYTKHLREIVIDGSAPCSCNFYIDNLSVYCGGSSSWTNSGGTATRTTDTTHQHSGQIGCQRIHCTANGQYYYFEENLPISADTARVDAWLRTPPPISENRSGDDVMANNFVTAGTQHWGTYGTPPYVKEHDHMDDNHIYFSADTPPVTQFGDYITFENLATALGKTWLSSISATIGGCTLSVSGRIQNNIGGSGTLKGVSISADLWVQHYNNGAGGWEGGVASVTNFESTSWTNLWTPAEISYYLTSYEDWVNARVRFVYFGYEGTTGTPNYAQFQIGQVMLKFTGTISGGEIDLLKLYNSSVGIGTCSAIVGVIPSKYSYINQNCMRYYINGPAYVINGEWSNALPTGGVTGPDFPVLHGDVDIPDPWVHISLFVHIGNGDGYVKLFNITNWDGASVDVNGFPTDGASLLCEVTGLNNTSYGLPDRVRYEAEYYWNYGNNSNSRDTYLDRIQVYVITETHTVGYINAGVGPEVTLLTVTNNFYPDIIHSWCPRQMSNIKIYADDDPDNATHGWEITQIYVYKTDPVKYRVVLDSCTNLTDEYKLTFNSSGYTPTGDLDKGLSVYHDSFDDIGPNYIGILLDADDDNYEWRVDITGGNYIPKSGDAILLYTTNGISGTGTGTLSVDAPSVWSGGPYIYLDDSNIDLSMFTQDELVMIGPMNIPKNRLLDTLWDICVYVNDDYTPFEWWIEYPSVGDPTRCIGDFHMGPRVGSDKSGSVSFTTGINMEEVKYQKSSRDTYQRCQVIGTGEGKNQDDCSSFWQNDQDAMDEIQGFFEDIVTQKQVSGGRVANRYAKVKLKLDASPKRKNAIDCFIGRDVYPSGTYDVGDDVALTDILSGLSGSYRIWNTKVSVDDNGEKVELICQAPYLDISNVWKNVYQTLKQIGVQGAIAQDWAGQGTSSDEVGADKLTTLFSKTAQNEEKTAKTTNDPQWEESSGSHNAHWKADSGNLTIFGGDTDTEAGTKWVELRYDTQYDASDNRIDEYCNIEMYREPKFTTTFKVYEPDSSTHWRTGDYVDFGLFHQPDGTGFLIRVVCMGANEFNAYAIYCSTKTTDYAMPLADMIAAGIAKLITGIIFNHKYKATIQVEYNGDQYGNPFPEVLVSIADAEADNPISRNVVWTKFNSPSMAGATTTSVFTGIIVRPIYIFASGTGGSGYRCQMNFYDIKTEWDMI